MKATFIQLLQRLGTQIFGPTTFKTQCRAMEKGDIKIPEGDLRAGTHQMFQINRFLPYLGIYGEEYLLTELNKIIVKSLPTMAQRKYLIEGGNDLEDQADILEMMTQLNKKFRLKKEFAELEKNNNNNNNNNGKSNQSSNGNNKGGNGGRKKSTSNPCRKYDGAHEWKDCPDNKSNNKSKSDKDASKEKKSKGDLYLSQAANEPAKKTTLVVRVGKPTSSKEVKADCSSDESAMMVQVVNHNHTTVSQSFSRSFSDGVRYRTTLLIDNGYVEYMIMSYPFATSLGYKLQKAQGRSYNTTNGLMTTTLQVSINNSRLPHLSQSQTFSATIQVVPEQSGDFGYSMIMGCQQMDLLGIDTSRTEKVITWGSNVTIPMVPTGYWTDNRIWSLLLATAVNTEQAPDGDIFATFTNADAMPILPTSTFLQAIYKKLDLHEIVKRDGSHLTSNQQALLFQVLAHNEAAFQGGKGEYTSAPVGIILKPNAKPWRAKPYPIPLKNRDILEGKLQRQCNIGAMRQLTPPEFEEQEWAFPAFGIPKKNGTICLVIDFR
jgi:hypothetical protein